jgi:hypothetical protein
MMWAYYASVGLFAILGLAIAATWAIIVYRGRHARR